MANSIDLRQQADKKRQEAQALQTQVQQKMQEAASFEQKAADAAAQEQKVLQDQQAAANNSIGSMI